MVKAVKVWTSVRLVRAVIAKNSDIPMIQQLEIIGTIYDLLALCSSYILNELKNESYEFELFNEDMYENVYNALNRYVCEEHERGERAAFDELDRKSVV